MVTYLVSGHGEGDVEFDRETWSLKGKLRHLAIYPVEIAVGDGRWEVDGQSIFPPKGGR